MTRANPGTTERGRRPGTNAAAFILGLPLAAAVLATLHVGPLRNTPAYRYIEYPVENVEVALFCCALGTLAAKLWINRSEQRALSADVLPRWDGKPVPVADAAKLLAHVSRLPRRLQNTYLARRVSAVLDFLCQRRTAVDLDDQLRALADNDSLAMDSSYALTRFITWAIPILGFLGTVLGITGAISGVKSDDLELGSVTGGLAYAFDATALALGITMITMFCSFLTERAEGSVLEEVDRVIDRELAHRFQRGDSDLGPLAEGLRQNAAILLESMQQLVERQAAVWAQTMTETNRRAAEVEAISQERLGAALEKALERSLVAHDQRLKLVEKQAVDGTSRLLEDFGQVAVAVRNTGREQQEALARVAQGLAAHSSTLHQLLQGEKYLLQLQAALQHNLEAVSTTGAFEQALHSLTAAVHMLTARASAPVPSLQAPRAQPGKAA
jgi:biopolymer transport protein ExbB/TolQ